MKNNSLAIRPYRYYIVISFFGLVISLFFWCFWGIAGFHVLGLVPAVLMLIGSILCYRKSREVYVFDGEGVRIFRCGGKGYCFIPWASLSYAYFVSYSLKKTSVMVLSSRVLDLKQAKKFAGKFRPILLSEEEWVVPLVSRIGMEISKEESEIIRALVKEKVPNVETEKGFEENSIFY